MSHLPANIRYFFCCYFLLDSNFTDNSVTSSWCCLSNWLDTSQLPVGVFPGEGNSDMQLELSKKKNHHETCGRNPEGSRATFPKEL